MNIKKRCNRPGCNELIDTTETYCNNHKNYKYKQYERARTSTEEGKEYKQFYSSKEWRQLRYQTLLNCGFICEICNKAEATIGDHIIPTKVNWNLRLDRDNIQGVCVSCHNKKTAQDKLEYGICPPLVN